MAAYACLRCGEAIGEQDERLTVSVVVRWSPDDRDALEEFELCASCAAQAEDHLVLETTYHEPM